MEIKRKEIKKRKINSNNSKKIIIVAIMNNEYDVYNMDIF